MKSTNVTSMSASLLLIALIVGQVVSFKLVKQPANGYGQAGGFVSTQAQQEEAIQREQLEQQRQIALLQQQQQQAEYQIYQQQLEADRFLKQHQSRNQESTSSAGGVKGYTPIAYPPPSRPQQQPAPAPGAAAPYRPVESQQFAPPHSTIAYLVVRPPYPTQLPYDESPFRGYLPPLTRPQAYSEYPRQTSSSFEASASGIKGERQEEVSAPPPPPPQPQPLPPPPPPPAAVVVPVHGDKHGKLRAMLDKLMSKLSFSTYEVTGEEYIYPPAPGAAGLGQPNRPPQQEPQPVALPQAPAQNAVQQQTLEQEQIRDEAEEIQQPIQQQQQQQIIQQEQQQLQQQQQPQQQVSVEQERDDGFDEAPVKAPAPATARPFEQTKQEVKDELITQQQQLQEQDFNRQPSSAPTKGGLQQQQQQQQLQPIRQPEQFQPQRQEDAIKGPKKGYATQQQQILYPQHESIRQEQKGGY